MAMAALDASDFPAVYAGNNEANKYLSKAHDGDSITGKKELGLMAQSFSVFDPTHNF